MEAIVIKTAKVSFKVIVINGNNKISFEIKDKELNKNETLDFLTNEIIDELQNLHDANEKMKSLGYKGNFFSFTKTRKCILSVESKKETEEGFTFIKNLQFSFGKLLELTDPSEGLKTVIKAAQFKQTNNILIEKC